MNILDRSRHPINCIVIRAQTITPHMRRLVLGGPELTAWLSTPGIVEPAAWVKVFPPGLPGRAYTLRSIDLEQSTLTLDFVLHGSAVGHGTVSSWARQARPGDALHIAGPRSGGFALLPESTWLWIGADASALPAAMRIIEHLPKGFHVRAFLAVDGTRDRQTIVAAARLHVRWRTSAQQPESMAEGNKTMQDIGLLSGPGQVWIAGEARWVKRWRSYWIDAMRLEPSRISSKGYWKLGEIDYRD